MTQAADEARNQGQFFQAVHLYALSKDDESVASILIDRLAELCKETYRHEERQECERQARDLLQRTEGGTPLGKQLQHDKFFSIVYMFCLSTLPVQDVLLNALWTFWVPW